jgi:ABC-type multidrug transport system fused ATPase/permease subunit
MVSLRSKEEDLEKAERRPLLEDIEDQDVVRGDGTDIVQLSAPFFYVEENEDSVAVEIIRLGSLHGAVSVDLSTKDVSAASGRNYVRTKETIVFEQGQHTKKLEIPILNDGEWTPSTEFRIRLKNPEDCRMGLNLHTARVKIINDDRFPSNSYEDVLQEGEEAINKIDTWILFGSFLQFTFNSTGVRWQTLLCIVMDQLRNVCLFVSLCVGVYMVDIVFDRGHGKRELIMGDRYHEAVLIALWYVVPIFVLFAWDACKVFINIQGTVRKFLQKSMLRSFLAYTQASRRRVTPIDLDVVICESADVASRGYMAAIGALQSMGKIAAVLTFVCLYQPDYHAIASVALMPLLLLAFTLVRVGPTKRAQEEADIKLRVLVMLSHEFCLKYRLIADFYKRHIMSDVFSKSVDDYTGARRSESMVKLVTLSITRFLSGFFICYFIIRKTPAVLSGEFSLGLFLATITIFGTYLSDAITELNNDLNNIVQCFATLQEFTLFFNLPIELMMLKEVSRVRHSTTTKRRSVLMRGTPRGTDYKAGDIFADALDIKLENVAYEYDNILGKIEVFSQVNLAVPQGTMVAIAGDTCAGKKTLLELLSDIIMPTRGVVYVPSHLRVLHVSREPMFLKMSLLHNLTFGMPDRQQVDMDRVHYVLKLMNLSHMSHMLDEDGDSDGSTSDSDEGADAPRPRAATQSSFGAARDSSFQRRSFKSQDVCASFQKQLVKLSRHEVTAWVSKTSHTQQVKLHLCRALLANPNVLLMQRPLHHFQETTAAQLIDVFRTHLQDRGLGYPEGTTGNRRPRTLFYIADTPAQAKKADVVWTVSADSTSVTSDPPVIQGMLPPRGFSRGTSPRGISCISPCR